MFFLGGIQIMYILIYLKTFEIIMQILKVAF